MLSEPLESAVNEALPIPVLLVPVMLFEEYIAATPIATLPSPVCATAAVPLKVSGPTETLFDPVVALRPEPVPTATLYSPVVKDW